ncbi:MAG: hypothetical protein FWE53_05300 [Firmicutes bacterium]|nr:hypothetical protein [Bacillota bacterium]
MFKLKMLTSGLVLMLALFCFAACGDMYNINDAKKALTDKGCTVTVIDKTALPSGFAGQGEKISSCYKVSKGTEDDVFLVEFKSVADAEAAFTALSNNKVRAGHLIMFTTSDVTEAGDAKVIWEAFKTWAEK